MVHDVSSILGQLLVMLVLLWLAFILLRRVKDIVRTNSVAARDGSDVRREDHPARYWYTVIGLVTVAVLAICLVIRAAIAFFIG
jgi:hypothetical protein